MMIFKKDSSKQNFRTITSFVVQTGSNLTGYIIKGYLVKDLPLGSQNIKESFVKTVTDRKGPAFMESFTRAFLEILTEEDFSKGVITEKMSYPNYLKMMIHGQQKHDSFSTEPLEGIQLFVNEKNIPVVTLMGEDVSVLFSKIKKDMVDGWYKKADEPAPVEKDVIKLKENEVMICGVVFTKGDEKQSYIPKLDKNYIFPEKITKNICLDILENEKVFLTGHTGTGKTSLIQQIAARINQPVVRVNMNGQTSVHEFLGTYTLKGGETIWVDGVLPMAMRMGYWLIIDELDCAHPEILASLNSVLETNGTLTLKEKEFEEVVPKSSFRIFATGNSVGCMVPFKHLYPGTNNMNAAFLDRFRIYHVDYMSAESEKKVLLSVKGLSKKQADAMMDVISQLRLSFVKEEVTSPFSTRRALDWAKMTVRTGNLVEAAENVIFSKCEGGTSEADTIKAIIQKRCHGI